MKVCCIAARTGKNRKSDRKMQAIDSACQKFPGRWSRLPGGHSTQVNFCTKLSVHENLVIWARWSLNAGTITGRFYCNAFDKKKKKKKEEEEEEEEEEQNKNHISYTQKVRIMGVRWSAACDFTGRSMKLCAKFSQSQLAFYRGSAMKSSCKFFDITRF